MIQVLERDLHDVVIGIVGDTEQRQPVRFDLIAQLQRDDLDFRLFAFERARDVIEEETPLFLVELAGRHDEISVATACCDNSMRRVLHARAPRGAVTA